MIAVGFNSMRFNWAPHLRDRCAGGVPSHSSFREAWGTRNFVIAERNRGRPTGGESGLTHEAGLTLVELIITVAIIGILAAIAIPIARFQVRREKERELRRDLWEMRAAIDKYKDAADKGAFQIKADSLGYPPDLDTLVNGVDVQGKKVRFLRRIPVDPMTGSADWGMRSNQDDPDSDSFGGQNVFDVYTKSPATALDGTKYSTW